MVPFDVAAPLGFVRSLPEADQIRQTLVEMEARSWAAIEAITTRGAVSRPCDDVILAQADALEWLDAAPENTVHGIVTDPPYGLIEYEGKDHTKLRNGRGGVWRIPPAIDGIERSPVPRFTVLTNKDRSRLEDFFITLAERAFKVLVPGGHLMIASNPLLSTATFSCFEKAGFEKRGEIIRLVQTLRGGDRPKGAEVEYSDVTVMPRSNWEPWGLFRKPISEKTVAANLRLWGAGALRRVSAGEPFRDVIESAPTRASEREIAPHPSLKPQKLMRQLVRAVLPLGIGVVYDPFVGGGSTLAAAARIGYRAVGTELDREYATTALGAIPRLRDLYGGDNA